MLTLIVLGLVTVAFIAFFFLMIQREKTTINAKLTSSTEFVIGYRINKESGKLQINKSSDCSTPVITPTITGWRVTVPLHYTDDQTILFFKSKPLCRHIKSTHWLGLDILSFFFCGRYEGKEVFKLNQEVKDLLIETRNDLKPHFENFFKPYPDVHFTNESYVHQFDLMNIRKMINEHSTT